jgi:hypothetical protein
MFAVVILFTSSATVAGDGPRGLPILVAGDGGMLRL